MSSTSIIDLATVPDVIDHIVGISQGSWLDSLRSRRSVLRENARLSTLALFRPAEEGDVSLLERHSVAAFVAGLHAHQPVYAFYAAALRGVPGGTAHLAAIEALLEPARTRGPYGKYPEGPLSTENLSGIVFEASAEGLDARLAAAFRHAHLLVFHPRDASQAAIEKLLDAGWTISGIVTLSQLVSFLTFQIRVIHGLSVLRDAGPEQSAGNGENV
ncbi:CMD domain protein [Gluconacetobacter tumulisoli]|uniref:CMD domain protein n=1 Tax=Gluconacetobacter tumulisoli TaxID=1286189 RepID=A0A7W4K9K0_9PROT|nr:CMD domain protein [Gluconacetobacter tumulisoli]MBB2202815.1 CMD domain protein [Gluconacetobacter tumulisoli]